MLKPSHFLLCTSCLLLFSCKGKGVSVGKDPNSMGTDVIRQVMPGKGPVDVPGHGKEVWFAIAPLAGLDIPANGVAQAHYLEDGASIVTIQLNIERPKRGSFYEAWLVGKDPADRLSVGQLRTPFGDVRHSLKFLEKVDVRPYSKVEVTKELDDGNPGPGTVVAEGVLTERKR